MSHDFPSEVYPERYFDKPPDELYKHTEDTKYPDDTTVGVLSGTIITSH